MKRPTPNSDVFAVSMLDVLMGALGAVIVLLILFAAMGRRPPGMGEQTEVFQVEVRSAPGVEIGDEVSLFLANRPNGTSPFTSIEHLEDPGLGSKSRLARYERPETHYSLKAPRKGGEEWILGIWWRRLTPPQGDVAPYLKVVKEGVTVRVRHMSIESAASIDVRLEPSNAWTAFVALRPNLSRTPSQPVSWNTQTPEEPRDVDRTTLRADADLVWWEVNKASRFGWYDNAQRKGTMLLRLLSQEPPQRGSEADKFLKDIREPLASENALGQRLVPFDKPGYLAVGRRGVCVWAEERYLLFFRGGHRQLAETLVNVSAGTHGIIELTREESKRLLARFPPSTSLPERVADALADGFIEHPRSPVTRQDPLLTPAPLRP